MNAPTAASAKPSGVSAVITLPPEQLRPVPEFSSAIGSDHLLAIGSVAGGSHADPA